MMTSQSFLEIAFFLTREDLHLQSRNFLNEGDHLLNFGRHPTGHISGIGA